MVVKSWEGSLNQGGVRTVYDGNGASKVVPNAVGFNVTDPVVIKTLQSALNSGKRVELTYSQWFIAPPSISNTRVVTSAKEVE